jgi:hypothetical protein
MNDGRFLVSVTVVSVVFGFPQCIPGYGYGQRGSAENTDVCTTVRMGGVVGTTTIAVDDTTMGVMG